MVTEMYGGLQQLITKLPPKKIVTLEEDGKEKAQVLRTQYEKMKSAEDLLHKDNKMVRFSGRIASRVKRGVVVKKLLPLDKLRPNIIRIKEFVKREDQDWVILIVGGEGSGKSTLALQIALLLDPLFDVRKQLIYNFKEEQYSYLEFLRNFKDKPLRSVVFDEAITSLFSRQHASKDNANIIKLFNMNRTYNHFSILVVPSFWSMDKDIRERRARTLLYVFQDRDNYSRKYAYYSREKIADISSNDYLRKMFLSPKKFLRSIPPEYVEPFGPMGGQVWRDYIDMKRDYLLKTIIESEMPRK